MIYRVLITTYISHYSNAAALHTLVVEFSTEFEAKSAVLTINEAKNGYYTQKAVLL